MVLTFTLGIGVYPVYHSPVFATGMLRSSMRLRHLVRNYFRRFAAGEFQRPFSIYPGRSCIRARAWASFESVTPWLGPGGLNPGIDELPATLSPNPEF